MTLEDDLKEMYPNDSFIVKRKKNHQYSYIEIRKSCVKKLPEKSMVSELINISMMDIIQP